MTTRHAFAAALCVVSLGVAASLVLSQRNRGIPAGDDSPPVTLRFFKEPEAVPAFTVTTLDGRTISSADLSGKVTLINFWATWCGPCRAEIPDLVALQERYREDLLIIGVSEDEGGTAEVERFAREHRINYPIVMATPQLHEAFPGIVALPTSYLLNRDARIVQRQVGLLDRTLTERATQALAGLPVNASIELVEPDQPVGLADTAQVKEIPGVDLSTLSTEQRVEALQRLNAEGCSCGCGLTVAKCRIDDPACGVSLPIARRMVGEIAGTP
ncbi:MAG: TlpA family protein disulfide reductase [Acidobacteriota bacterium]